MKLPLLATTFAIAAFLCISHISFASEKEVTETESKPKLISHFTFFPKSRERPSQEREDIDKIKSNEGLTRLFKNKKFRFLPMPVISSKPVIGQTYGAILSMLLVDKDTDRVSSALSVSPRYNTNLNAMLRLSAAIYPHFYTQPRESFIFSYEIARNTLRRLLGRYFNPRLVDLLYTEFLFERATDPFGRFYNFGADTSEGGVSSYTSKRIMGDAKVGFYLSRTLRINTAFNISYQRIRDTIFSDVPNTLAVYGSLAEVRNTTNLKLAVSLTYDTRKNGKESEKGLFLETGPFFSIKNFASDYDQIGFYIEGIALIPWLEGRTQTALRFFLQDMYGTGVPFYQRSALGGANEFRAYVPNRFVDTGKILLQLEQRFRILSAKFYKTTVNLDIDPYFAVGRVFHHLNNLSFDHIKPMGGVGVRISTPPTFRLRTDISYGDEGATLYITVGYPF